VLEIFEEGAEGDKKVAEKIELKEVAHQIEQIRKLLADKGFVANVPPEAPAKDAEVKAEL
jgi:DNA topoisomerase IB